MDSSDAATTREIDDGPGDDAGGPADWALSPSRASDFMSCPLKFRFRSIDRIPEPPSAAAARGTLVHGVLQRLFERPAAERTAQAATASIPALWAQMLAAHPELGGLPETVDEGSWLAAADLLINTYFRLEDPRRFEPEACELRLEVTVAETVRTRGFVDRLDVSPTGQLRVVDYKTGKAPRAAYADEALFQLKFYALMLYRLRGVVVTRLRLIYLGDGRLLEYDPDEAALISFERRVTALWTAIDTARSTGDFPPRRSKLCDWCSFRSLCPEFGGTPPPYPLATSAAT